MLKGKKRVAGGMRQGRMERWMEVRWLVGGMLYIGIDPQEAPSKIE